MSSTTKETLPSRIREFHTPDDFGDRTLFDAFVDVFSHPEDLPRYQPESRLMGRFRAANNIRRYFEKAVNAEKERQREIDPSN